MAIREGLNHFQFYDHQIIHQEIQAESLRNHEATIGQAEFDLSFDSMPFQAKLMGQAGFIGGFQQPRAKCALDPDRGANHSLRQFSMGTSRPQMSWKDLFCVFPLFSVYSVTSFFIHGWYTPT